MGFNIKNNYGPNIEVNAGGKVTLTQDRSGLWHTVDAEDAEYDEVFEPCQLIFFDNVLFGSAIKQKKLFDLLSEVSSKFDISSGRGWFCIYAGYRYFKGELAVLDGYTDFFTDIENLLPDKLPKLDSSIIEKRERYHNYAQLLGREAALWYMDKGKLPPSNEITTWKEYFRGDKKQVRKVLSNHH